MTAQDYYSVFKYFLFFFSILTFLVSVFIYFRPQVYWKYTLQSMKFKGITGAKASKRFYWWVRVSALVQMVLAGIIFIIFLYLTSKA